MSQSDSLFDALFSGVQRCKPYTRCITMNWSLLSLAYSKNQTPQKIWSLKIEPCIFVLRRIKPEYQNQPSDISVRLCTSKRN